MRRTKQSSVATPEAKQPAPSTPRYVPDHVMAPMIGVSVSFLQKDRTTAKKIPCIRIGDKVVYHPPTVFAALEARQG